MASSPWPAVRESRTPCLFIRSTSARTPCGRVLEGHPEPDDIDPDTIELYGFHLRDPHGPGPAEPEELIRAVDAMEPPRRFTLGPDGSLVECGDR